jgi:hypothetical protein
MQVSAQFPSLVPSLSVPYNLSWWLRSLFPNAWIATGLDAFKAKALPSRRFPKTIPQPSAVESFYRPISVPLSAQMPSLILQALSLVASQSPLIWN